MKKKCLILLAICSMFCVLGCSCKEEQPGGNSYDSSSSSMESISSEQEEIVVKKEPIVSVNQLSVTISVGDTYTLTATAENVENAQFSWSIEGDAAADVVSLVQTGNTVTLTALGVGQTKLVAALEYDGHVYFRNVNVTVTEKSNVSLVLSDNVGFDNNGYHVDLSTLSTANGDETSIVPLVTVYKNNQIVPGAMVRWSSENTDIVAVDGNKFVSVQEGTTRVVGACTVGDDTYTVEISVNVYRPTIALAETYTVEVENLSKLSVSTDLKGISRGVAYNGALVGAYDMQTKTITLEKSKLPTQAAVMGENRLFTVETSAASYAFNVNLYTKIISDKAEFEGIAELSKATCSTNAALWDGYFVLDNDIAYNGLFQSKIADIDSLWAAVEGNWSNGGLYGFRGVIDGKGHTIDGISIDNGSGMGGMIGVLHIDGVVKNLSFTNASVAANSALVCGAGGGTVENVYIQYASVGKGTQHYEGNGSINTHCGSFFSFKEPTATANVSNCVVDVTKAVFEPNTSIKLVGSEFASIKNVFVIGGTEELRKASNATLAFPAVADFVQNTNVQNRYKKFDGGFWSFAAGVPVSQNVYEQIRDNDVHFTVTADCLVSGTAYQFAVDNSFSVITSSSENVTVQGDVATVLATATNGEQVTITVSSIFDDTKTDSITCTLAVVDYTNPENIVDLTKEKATAFYDITLDKVYFADLASKIGDEALYFVNADFSSVTFGKDGDKAQEIIAVTKNKFYKMNCLSVTKVISQAADLLYMRRDYTVTSYNNPGCYDGLLLGTFVMINDVDCTGLELSNTGRYWENSRGFRGTFDGRGYTVSNLTAVVNGLFGSLSYATIKNVNFTHIKMVDGEDGAYVSLFATRAFNSLVENVSMQFDEYILGASIYGTSGLMIYETSFDCQFTNVEIDVSKIPNVKYIAECYYGADLPYLSENKSTYSDITVIVANLDNVPAFAYNTAQDTSSNIVAYPDGVTIKDVDGNVKA